MPIRFKNRKSHQTNPAMYITAIISGLLFTLITTASTTPKNVIGFFQTYDAANGWYFNTPNTPINKSGYTMLIDAFWINYPFCWGDGSGQPGQGSPIPICKNIKNAPGPGLTASIDSGFWQHYNGEPAPSTPGDTYNTYWTSLHTSGPQLMTHLHQQINNNGNKIKLLASIGGWNMGGSSAGQPNTPKPPQAPAWAALLKDPHQFANAMSSILSIKANDTTLYDGIDLDMETLYAMGCSGQNNTCTNRDKLLTINNTVQAIIEFKQAHPTAILSTSPRASDIYCAQQYCPWHDADGLGFSGKIIKELAKYQVYFNDINPQFYNDDAARNIPNGIDTINNSVSIGQQVPDILQHLAAIVGNHSDINIGVLAQTDQGMTDSGGASSVGNPGVAKRFVPILWKTLQTDPTITKTGVKISGLMTWAANLAFSNALPGNIRSTNSSNVVPYNWAAGPYTINDRVQHKHKRT